MICEATGTWPSRLQRVNGLAPIVEDNSGKREFLRSAYDPYLALYVASRTEPFPDATSLDRVLKAMRSNEQWPEQYGIGRVANNLGAVLTCHYHAQAQPAQKALREAELKFLEMINEACPYPVGLTYGGLAMVRYNVTVLYLLLGDLMKSLGSVVDPDEAKLYANAAERARVSAIDTLDEAEELGLNMTGDDDWEFVRSALAALPVLT